MLKMIQRGKDGKWENKALEVRRFPAGELNINIENVVVNSVIELIYEGSDDLIALGLVQNAFKQTGRKVEKIIMHYTPYGRQDRMCNEGEAFSLEFFASYINSLGFDEVYVTDPHSYVQLQLINNLQVYSQQDVWLETLKELKQGTLDAGAMFTLCSPDKGAVNKTKETAKQLLTEFDVINTLYCDKVRNPKDGKLSGFSVPADFVSGTCVIVDDIIDGGGTFVGLAQELRKKGAETIILCGTHGIFSKGFDVLLEEIDYIYTTDSLPYASVLLDKLHGPSKYQYRTQVHIIPLEDTLEI